MEEFFKTTAEKLKSEEKAFISSIDPYMKELYADIYDCSSKCYLLPTSLPTSKICAKNCAVPGVRIKQEIKLQMEKCQRGLQDCVKSCIESNPESEEAGKGCIDECSEKSVQMMQNMTIKVTKLFNNHK
ncbi:unnamed protein product [Blepharisma stoltei]|uniref:Uncharacterized protein n=1 Tax=Blepharisma stoltei TaxID=1481888 RepID=A0AAU9K159_9CILI|nr:unnamed protein product [Blepharisma stoltei]